MPQSMLNAARQAGRLFANRPAANSHRSCKYFRIKCVDDFYFRFKYVSATYSRGASYAFENKIESRNYCRIKCVAPTRKNAAPWNQIPAHRQGVEGEGVGGPPRITFVMARAWVNWPPSSPGPCARSEQ